MPGARSRLGEVGTGDHQWRAAAGWQGLSDASFMHLPQPALTQRVLVKRPGPGSKLLEFKFQLCCLLIAMTLGKLVNVMVPQSPNLEIGDNYSINLIGLL